ncbi:MAG: SMP-30/gluconolactonase/LRE family protein [Bacteroidota bacterium]
MKTRITLILLAMIATSCTQTPREEAKVEIADSSLCQLGEGAFWDGPQNRLLYVDITGSKLFEYFPETGKKESYDMPSMIGTVVPEDETHVIVALIDGIYRFTPESGELSLLVLPEGHTSTQRFNDGKCDPEGRLWVGSMSLTGEEKMSFLYRVDQKGQAEAMLDSITISNGIAWNSKGDKMYYVDTPTRIVMEYEYDRASGELGKGRQAIVVTDTLGSPDGMSIDEEDKLWIAMWGGSAVCRYDPVTGRLMERIMVPAKNVTSCAFGGRDRNILYITTAGNFGDKEADEKYPLAGSLFKMRTPVKGPQFKNYINYIN